jgi:hypothetical protein
MTTPIGNSPSKRTRIIKTTIGDLLSAAIASGDGRVDVAVQIIRSGTLGKAVTPRIIFT